jgi:hypothetical protein
VGIKKDDDYGREVPGHGESRHEEHMYALYGNKAVPPVVKEPSILEKALMDIGKMDPKLAAESATAMVTLMGRVMDTHFSSPQEQVEKQRGIVTTFVLGKPSPATVDILTQMTVEQVTGEPYKAPATTAPTATLNAPKAK